MTRPAQVRDYRLLGDTSQAGHPAPQQRRPHGYRTKSKRKVARATTWPTGSTGRLRFSTEPHDSDTYWAKTKTHGLDGRRHKLPGAVRLCRRPIRRSDGTARGRRQLQSRQSVSCDATTCAETSAGCGSARARGRARSSGRYFFMGALGVRREWRRARWKHATRDAEFAVEFQNGDRFSVNYNGMYEFLPAPFPIAPGVTVPVRRLPTTRHVNGRLQPALHASGSRAACPPSTAPFTTATRPPST